MFQKFHSETYFQKTQFSETCVWKSHFRIYFWNI